MTINAHATARPVTTTSRGLALRRRTSRPAAARAVAGVVALALAAGASPGLQAPWHAYVLGEPVSDPALHAWHVALTAAVDVLAAVILGAYAARGSRYEGVAVPLAAVSALVVLVNLPFSGPLILIPAGVLTSIAVLGDARRHVRRAAACLGRNRTVTTLAASVALISLPYAVACYARQIDGVDAVASNNDYASTAEHVLLLTIVLTLASTGLLGAELLLGGAGLTLAYLAAAATSVQGPAAPAPWLAVPLAVLAVACFARALRRSPAGTAGTAGAAR